MIPLFDQEKRRSINLGGISSASTQTAILHRAKAQRSERQDSRRRLESAVRIQAWWRGVHQSREVKQQLKQKFEKDVLGISGLRCLALIGRDDEVLGKWSEAIVSGGKQYFFQQAYGPQRQSWLVLTRRASLLILQSVADHPQSSHAVAHLRVLDMLLSTSVTTKALGPQGSDISIEITKYLLHHDLFRYFSKAIMGIPVEEKSSPSLPVLVPLLTHPFSSFNAFPYLYSQSLMQLFEHILSIPLLPNRISIASLSTFSARLPIVSSLNDISLAHLVFELPTDRKIHLVSNLVTFLTPRYPKLTAPGLIAYLSILTSLLDSLPIHALEPPSLRKSTAVNRGDELGSSSEDEDDAPRVTAVQSFAPPAPPLPPLDSRTLKRLQNMISLSHLSSILKATQNYPSSRPELYSFLLTLCTIWPERADGILSALVVSTNGALVRELYRFYVRSSPLGRDDNAVALMDPVHAPSWPPLVFLTDLYTQSLLTMGDDEFFSSVTAASTAARNPLTLDELTSFSRQLLNIAFILYWREDQTNVQQGGVPGIKLNWEGVREKVTKCLQAIHARDSRKQFTPPGHWLVSSQIDLSSFIEAAIFEEQQLTQPVGSRPLTKRQISYLSPRLGILNNIPFAIPFEVRVSIFRHFVANDMVNRGINRFQYPETKTRAKVRRGHIAEDGFDKLGDADLRMPIEITFIDQFGYPEAGIDGGGVFKEFLTDLCKEAFDSDRGLWLANKQNELYPNPHSYATDPHNLNWYRFIGRILGKALYEGILIDVVFASFFLAKWLGKQSFLDDLASLDPDLYHGLIFLKHYHGNHEDLSLNFAVTEEEFGVAKTIDLCPNGSNMPVTSDNKLEYIYRMSHYRLTKQIKRQSEAFFEGLSDIIDPKWLRMFNQQELQVLLGGVDSPVDLDDLREHTNYGGLYDDNQQTVVAFWKVVNTFDHEQRRALLRFVTSVGRPPLLGFKELVPNFSIRAAGTDETRLPTSSTCVNLLKLPMYQSEHVLREKLLQAIYAGAGFDLS
ncbi:hypothetical protein EW146_g3984 [Bondarzewia mesenterica]|uniref:HECT-type E3 ubiquitin transferase n=1 Tax=Bondarzewia mesenterica TaxID=1095465 RepID=A0A4S4LW00_9AGAM|nr:hypothetical protein EW146_g3984 [Bondarzewia mesenterica]